MRALVSRVAWAEVEVDGRIVGRIGPGLLVYAAVGVGDTAVQAAWLAEKIASLRIFEDEQGKLNRSCRDVRGEILAISNFTLLADASKGRRPSLAAAAGPQEARGIHEAFLGELRHSELTVATGIFGASMAVRSQAAGPVNVLIDTPPRQQSGPASAAPTGP